MIIHGEHIDAFAMTIERGGSLEDGLEGVPRLFVAEVIFR